MIKRREGITEDIKDMLLEIDITLAKLKMKRKDLAKVLGVRDSNISMILLGLSQGEITMKSLTKILDGLELKLIIVDKNK